MISDALPRLKVGSILRRADGVRFVVKAIRKADEPLEPQPLKSRRKVPRRRKPLHNTGFSFVLQHGSPYFPDYT
jgi:hypothetical protein